MISVDNLCVCLAWVCLPVCSDPRSRTVRSRISSFALRLSRASLEPTGWSPAPTCMQSHRQWSALRRRTSSGRASEVLTKPRLDRSKRTVRHWVTVTRALVHYVVPHPSLFSLSLGLARRTSCRFTLSARSRLPLSARIPRLHQHSSFPVTSHPTQARTNHRATDGSAGAWLRTVLSLPLPPTPGPRSERVRDLRRHGLDAWPVEDVGSGPSLRAASSGDEEARSLAQGHGQATIGQGLFIDNFSYSINNL